MNVPRFIVWGPAVTADHSDQSDFARKLLLEILAEAGSLKGAQLASRLRREYELRSGRPFQLSSLGVARFVEFLQAHPDVVDVTREDHSQGDVVVSLRARAIGEAVQAGATPRDAGSADRVRPEVWQAFTNPDPTRLRFYNRSTGRVAHYREPTIDENEIRAKITVQHWGDQAVQIDPIPGPKQKEWMTAFLDAMDIDQAKRETYDHLFAAEYKSSLNSIFTDSLGAMSGPWRTFRAARVSEAVREWAARNDLSIAQVMTGRSEAAPHVAPHQAAVERRRALHVLIDRLDDDDLARVQVPLEVVERLLRRLP